MGWTEVGGGVQSKTPQAKGRQWWLAGQRGLRADSEGSDGSPREEPQGTEPGTLLLHFPQPPSEIQLLSPASFCLDMK